MEQQLIEYKSSWRDEWLQWICGYANAQGGTLYIGKDDNGNTIGVKNPKRLLEEIPNKISSILGLVVDVDYLEDDGKGYIRITVGPSKTPISYRGKYYYRSGATLKELTGVALQEFILKKMGLSWESQIKENASLDDIDPEAIKYFVKRGIEAKRMPESARNSSIAEVLANLKLTNDKGQLTLAALLLFGKDPSKFSTGVAFKIGRFSQGASDLLMQDIIECNWIQMVDKVMEVLDSKYLVRPIHYEGIQRIEPLEIPVEALREMICNSIIHKDLRGQDIMMWVYNDRIRLWNYGTLPEGMTLEKMLTQHESVQRNPLIAKAFYYAGFIEAWGRGIEKIQKAFSEEGLEMPNFEASPYGFEVNIKRENYLKINGSNGQKDVQSNVQKDVQSKLSDRQRLILDLISKDMSITLEKMSKATSVSVKTLYRDIAKLKEMGILVREGDNFNGYWKIKK